MWRGKSSYSKRQFWHVQVSLSVAQSFSDDSAELQNDKAEFLPGLFVTLSTKSDLFLACMFCFPISDHVMIPQRTVSQK